MKWLLAILLLPTSMAWGQVVVVPQEVPQEKLARATLTIDIPEGSYLADGGWEVTAEKFTNIPDMYATDREMVFVGPPGNYLVRYDSVILRDYTLPGEDGAPSETVPIYMGRIRGSATCKILGGGDDDDDEPDPPPPPPGNLYPLILEETGDSVPAWKNLKIQLRLAYRSSPLQILDQDNLAPSQANVLPAVREAELLDALPVLVVLDMDDGRVVRVVPCPPTVEEFKAELAK